MQHPSLVALVLLGALIGCSGPAPQRSRPTDPPDDQTDEPPVVRAPVRPRDSGQPSPDNAGSNPDSAGPDSAMDARSSVGSPAPGAADAAVLPEQDGGTAADGGSDAFPGVPALSDDALGKPRCAGSGLPVCLYFEGGFPAGWSRGGSVSIDGTHAARGGKALRVPTGNTGRHMIAGPWSKGVTVWGRMFARLTSPPVGHGEIVRLWGRNVAGEEATYNLGMINARFFNTYLRPNPHDERENECNPQYDKGKCDTDATLIPTGKWLCVEWWVDGVGGAPTKLFYNGVQLPLRHHGITAALANKWPIMNAFSRVEVGLMMYFSPRAGDMWIDELALDTQRIGCER